MVWQVIIHNRIGEFKPISPRQTGLPFAGANGSYALKPKKPTMTYTKRRFRKTS